MHADIFRFYLPNDNKTSAGKLFTLLWNSFVLWSLFSVWLTCSYVHFVRNFDIFCYRSKFFYQRVSNRHICTSKANHLHLFFLRLRLIIIQRLNIVRCFSDKSTISFSKSVDHQFCKLLKSHYFFLLKLVSKFNHRDLLSKEKAVNSN